MAWIDATLPLYAVNLLPATDDELWALRYPGTVIALMLPYAVILTVVWAIFFMLWFVLGIPLGPGWPV